MFRTMCKKFKMIRRDFVRLGSNIAKEKIAIKRICKDDYASVLSIRSIDEIYGGTDYLPDYFDSLLKAPNVEMYGAVIDDKLVAFEFASFVDNGKTVVTRAARVSKEYKGLGISIEMLKWFGKGGPLYKPDVRYHAVTKLGDDSENLPQPDTTDTGGGRCYEVCRKEVRYYTAKIPLLINSTNQLKKVITSSSSKTIDDNYLSKVLKDNQFCKHLFSGGRLLADCVPYRIESANSKLILKGPGNTVCVASDLDDPRSALLTFGSSYNTPLRVIVHFELYGNIERKLNEHICLQMRRILPKARVDDIIIRCFCSPNTNWDIVNTQMEELNIYTGDGYGSTMICTERKL